MCGHAARVFKCGGGSLERLGPQVSQREIKLADDLTSCWQLTEDSSASHAMIRHNVDMPAAQLN